MAYLSSFLYDINIVPPSRSGLDNGDLPTVNSRSKK